MANEKLAISGPVSVVSDSPSRVAFDLMDKIASRTYDADKEAQKTKDYWLKLYRQCYKATSGFQIESILKDD